MIEDSLLVETTRVFEPLSSTVLETRTGGTVGIRALLKAFLGADFKVSHFCPGSEAITRRPLRSLDAVGERMP